MKMELIEDRFDREVLFCKLCELFKYCEEHERQYYRIRKMKDGIQCKGVGINEG